MSVLYSQELNFFLCPCPPELFGWSRGSVWCFCIASATRLMVFLTFKSFLTALVFCQTLYGSSNGVLSQFCKLQLKQIMCGLWNSKENWFLLWLSTNESSKNIHKQLFLTHDVSLRVPCCFLSGHLWVLQVLEEFIQTVSLSTFPPLPKLVWYQWCQTPCKHLERAKDRNQRGKQREQTGRYSSLINTVLLIPE